MRFPFSCGRTYGVASVADGRGEPSDAGGVVRVPVGLARAAAEPAHLLDGRVEHEPQPDLGQRAGPAAVGRDVDGQAAVAVQVRVARMAEAGARGRDPQPGAQRVRVGLDGRGSCAPAGPGPPGATRWRPRTSLSVGARQKSRAAERTPNGPRRRSSPVSRSRTAQPRVSWPCGGRRAAGAGAARRRARGAGWASRAWANAISWPAEATRVSAASDAVTVSQRSSPALMPWRRSAPAGS